MADETLFERGRGDRSDDAPDVERVFSRAVERQLEEQQELNRLVKDTTDRLAALEQGLRSLREQTATNLTGLRSEMQDHTARLGDQVGEQIQQVAAEVDRLRGTSTDHQVRLVQLAEAAESAINALEARHVRLTDELTDVNEQLRADDRLDADALVATLDRFEMSLASRLDERFGALSHRLGRLQEQVQEDDGIDLAEELDEVRARIDALREHTDEVSREAAQRGAAQRRTEQQRLAERLREELRRELLDALGPLLEEQRPSSEEIEETVDGVVARRVGALDATLDRLASSLRSRTEELDGRIAAVADRLGEQAAERDEVAAEDRARLHEELRGQREELRMQLEPLDEVRQRLSGIDALHRRLDVLGQVQRQLEAMRDVPDRLEALESLEEVPGRLEALDSRLAVLEGHVGTQTEAVATFADDHERALRHVADTAAAVGPELVSHVRRALAPIAEDIADLDDQLRLVRASSTGDEETLEALRERLTEVIGMRLADVGHALAEHRETVDTAMRATADAVGDHRRAVDAAMRTTSESVGEHRDAVDRSLRASREAMSEHRESIAADLRADREALDEEVSAVLEAVETRLDDLDRALGTSLPETLARQREELASTLSEPLSDATERLVAAREELRGVAAELGGLPGELDGHLATTLDQAVGAAREEARTATSQVLEAVDRLDTVQEGLSGLENSLVAYLEARDVRLEHERMQVLRDLIEELAEGLSRRDRRRLARRLDEVREKIGLSTAPTDVDDSGPAGDPDGGGERPGLLAALLGESDPSERSEPSEPEVVDERPAETDTAGGASEMSDTATEAPDAFLERLLGEEDELAEATVQDEAEDEVQDDDEVDDEIEDARAPDDGHPCPECGFVAGNAGGLASHRRTHA